MPNKFSDAALREADAAIKTSQAYKPSKGEKRLDAIGDAVAKGPIGRSAPIAQSEIATETFSFVKDQVSNFAYNSKALMSVLDEVAKVHPFIQAAVSLFKTGLTLEMTRRENDDKVIALNLIMCDMMQTLTLLERVVDSKAPGPGGLSIEDRLQQRMGAIIDTIERCAKVCDSYQKRPTAVKFFTSVKWQGKFTDIAKQFGDHKSEIQSDLQIHASVGIAAANVTLTAVSSNVNQLATNVAKLMEVIFERMRSPEERELSAFVSAQRGGADAVLKNDKLLEQVLAKQKSFKDDKGGKRHAGPGPSDAALTVTELRKEVGKDVEQVLADNKFFDQKFKAMRVQVNEVKVTIKHETDRVINAVLAGPHERILDKDMYLIWKEMGWRGSVKAKHLVMALRDHFLEGSHAALAVIRDIISSKNDSDSSARVVEEIADVARRPDPNITPEDEWALQYITVLRVQPLIEALDDDVSSFVTVAEVNAFTPARPLNWSLPHWIAYWTFGFEMTVQWYFRRIRRLFSDISVVSLTALPGNSQIIANFFSSWQVRFVEDLLSGLHNVESWDDAVTDWDTDSMFIKFKDYVLENEAQMDRSLRTVNYCIDEANTLTLVAGEGRPEKYILPIIFLLLRRSLSVIHQAQSVTLHDEELEVIQDSLGTLAYAVWDRLRTLQAVYKLQNLNEMEQLSKFFYGLYTYIVKEPVASSYWMRSPAMDAHIIADVATSDFDHSDTDDAANELLFYGPQAEDLDSFNFDAISTEPLYSDTSASPSLVGHWSGSYAYSDGRDSDGLVSIFIASHQENGTISGSGIDALGPFTVLGTFSGDRLVLQEQYLVSHDGEKTAWRYQGTIDVELDMITGVWGPVDSDHGNYAPSDGDVEDHDDVGDHSDVEDHGDVGDYSSDGGSSDSGEQGVGDNSAEPGEGIPAIDVNELEIAETDGSTSGSDWHTVDDDGDGVRDGDGDSDGDSAGSHLSDGASVTGSALSGAATYFTHGTFFLKRRPVEYWLSRPSDEEFSQNRPRALWKLALNAAIRTVQSRTLSWPVLLARRQQQRRCVELLRLKEELWHLDPVDAEEWAELVETIHPEDLRLWRCIAISQMRRDIVHDGIRCDGCGATPLTSARYLCTVCSEYEVDHGIDLCADCFSDNKHPTHREKIHTPDHSVIQLRSIRRRVYLQSMISAAKYALAWAEAYLSSTTTSFSDGVSQGCIECKTPIKTKPYWCCIDCRSLTFVCCDCNKRISREKPWLLGWRSNADYYDTHDWSHTLAFAPTVDRGDEPSTSPSPDFITDSDRLARLEYKFDQQAVETGARLATLEQLLERLLGDR